MKKLIYLLMFGACVCLMGACTSEEADIVVEPEEEVEEVDVPEVVELVLNSKESAAAEQVQEFNYKFFKAVVANNPEKANVVCSPLSASTLILPRLQRTILGLQTLRLILREHPQKLFPISMVG